jgi:hypothetical protein
VSKTKAWIILILLTIGICGLVVSAFLTLPSGVVAFCIVALLLAISSE